MSHAAANAVNDVMEQHKIEAWLKSLSNNEWNSVGRTMTNGGRVARQLLIQFDEYLWICNLMIFNVIGRLQLHYTGFIYINVSIFVCFSNTIIVHQ